MLVRDTEHDNIAEKFPEKVKEMLARIDMIKQTEFLPVRCHCDGVTCDDGYGGRACSVTNETETRPGASVYGSKFADPAACELARPGGRYDSFWGPFVFP